MEKLLKNITSTRIISYVLFAFSLVILSATFYVLASVRVLEDWTLRLPPGPIHAGDQLVLISEYTKTRDVDGMAMRYIECKTRDSNVFIRYPINEAVADRAKGKAGTGVPLVVPRDIPDLPAVCKFSISITYDVLPFKKDYQKNSTPEFRLLPVR